MPEPEFVYGNLENNTVAVRVEGYDVSVKRNGDGKSHIIKRCVANLPGYNPRGARISSQGFAAAYRKVNWILDLWEVAAVR